MKSIFLVLFFVSTISAHANSISCKVLPSTQTDSVEIALSVNHNSVESIDYKFRVANPDGTFTDKTSRIFARWPMTRGEVKVDYCNPNENDYRYYNNSYAIWSVCSAPDGMTGQITFQADITINSGGKISFLKSDGMTIQKLNLTTCQ